jgi:mannan endo-1,4-beta-mannosidase
MRLDLGLTLLTVLLTVGCLRKPPGASHASVGETREGLQAAQADQQPSSEHFYTRGRYLYDRCGERVLLRGVNKMTIWTDPTGESFAEIAKTGANTVRLVWTIKDHQGAATLDTVLQKALAARLIPIIELHDATGDLSKVAELVDFWTRPEIVEVLQRHQATLLLNIGNEAGGNGVRPEEFVAVYERAVTRLRQAGLRMPLVIDAPRWGQDIDLLQQTAPALLQSDPERNLLFSVHMWWPERGGEDPGSTKRIIAELEESVAMGLPLIVGEFAHAGVGCSRFIDYQTILAEAEKH